MKLRRDKSGRFIQRAKAPRRIDRPARTPARRPSASALEVYRLGEVESIVYRHARGGTYRHVFRSGVHLYVTRKGASRLIIAGAGLSVKPFIED